MTISDTIADRMTTARSAQSRWEEVSVRERCKALRSLRHTIAAHLDEMVAVISDEVGKPPLDALSGDLMVALEQIRFYERNAHRILAARHVGKPRFFFTGTRFVESYEAHGIVLVFAPWNYPFQLAVIPAITALIAGNAVLLKCSERAPRTAALIEELCRKANLPSGLLQVSCEGPEEAAALIDARPDFIFFTGSSHNGQVVAQHAASLLIPTVLELGGKDACIVFAGCELPRTVEGAAYGAFSNAGQVCVGIKRIYVEQTIYQPFLAAFLTYAGHLRIGETPDADLGPIRFDSVRQRLIEQVEDAVARGATLHTPWNRSLEAIPPLVLTNVAFDARLLTEESFGPVACVMAFETEGEAVRLANSTAFALSGSVFTADHTQAQRVASQLNVGSCAINDVIRNIGNPQASFGGNGASGNGRYHGAAGLRTFSRIKSVMTARRLRSPEVHWFPFTARTFSRLRRLLLVRHSSGSLASRLRSWRGLSPLLFACLMLGAFRTAAAQQPDLILDVHLPPHARGAIAYLVFAVPGGFHDMRSNALRHGFVRVPAADNAIQRVDCGPLPPGRYAVSVYLDTNANHQLDRNLMGIPKEPVGASNNPRNRMGPPRFDDCAFMHGREAQTIPITLVR